MRRLVPLTIIMLCALVIGLGCGDDETTTITEYDTVIQTVTVTDSFTDTVSSPAVVTRAFCGITDVFDFWAEIYQTTSRVVIVDSVFAYDAACDLMLLREFDHMWGQFYYVSNVGSQPAAAGDIAGIEIYAEGTVSTAEVTLLDIDDTVDFVVEETSDSVGVDDPADVAWQSMEHADWYGIVVKRYLAVDMWDFWDYFYLYSEDTTVTIPGDLAIDDGEFIVSVIPVTGPSPGDQEENVTGGLVGGSIHSYAGEAVTVVKIGFGMPARAGVPIGTSQPMTVELMNKLLEACPTQR